MASTDLSSVAVNAKLDKINKIPKISYSYEQEQKKNGQLPESIFCMWHVWHYYPTLPIESSHILHVINVQYVPPQKHDKVIQEAA